MSRRDGAGLIVLVGVAAVVAALTGTMLDFVRPGMRTWVVFAGAVLVIVGVMEVWSSRSDEAAPDHERSRLGWLVAVPIVVGLMVGSGSLGVYAVGRNATFRDLPDAPTKFDLAQYLQAQSVGGRPIPLTLVDYVSAATRPAQRPLLEGHVFELTGFVSRDHGAVRLNRFVISCCAADAVAVQVGLTSGQALPEDGTWVRIHATPTTAADTNGKQSDVGEGIIPLVTVDEVEIIHEPRHPYEIPVSRIR